jgi:hypothetical protein
MGRIDLKKLKDEFEKKENCIEAVIINSRLYVKMKHKKYEQRICFNKNSGEVLEEWEKIKCQ